MTRTFVGILAALLWISSPAFAAEDAVPPKESGLNIDELAKKVVENGTERREAAAAAGQALEAGCEVKTALIAAVSGNVGGFTDSMLGAQKKLSEAADNLDKLSGAAFQKSVVIPAPTLAHLQTFGSIGTYADIVREISTHARASAAAIERMRQGHGTERDISLIVENDAVISQLVSLLFNFA
jgi:hypothetical protein